MKDNFTILSSHLVIKKKKSKQDYKNDSTFFMTFFFTKNDHEHKECDTNSNKI